MTIYHPVPENSYLRDCIDTEITELPDLVSYCQEGYFTPDVVQIDFGISGITLLGYDQFFQLVVGDVWENPDGGDSWFDNDADDVTGYWFQSFDNTRWTPTQGSWNGSAWVPSGGFVILEVLGAWNTGIRPTKIRITFAGNEAELSAIQIQDTTIGFAILNDSSGFTSAQEHPLVYQSPISYDIFELLIYDPTATYTITNIEFFIP
jgi:hypothetical protein